MTVPIDRHILLRYVVETENGDSVGRNNHFTLGPRVKGIRKILGELESDIVEVAWARGESSVRDVHQRLRLGNERELACTTVTTLTSRLARSCDPSRSRRETPSAVAATGRLQERCSLRPAFRNSSRSTYGEGRGW